MQALAVCKGNGNAMNNLGHMYALSVKERRTRWRRRGAAVHAVNGCWYGKRGCMNNLGHMYADGCGIEKDEVDVVGMCKFAVGEPRGDIQEWPWGGEGLLLHPTAILVSSDELEAVRPCKPETSTAAQPLGKLARCCR